MTIDELIDDRKIIREFRHKRKELIKQLQQIDERIEVLETTAEESVEEFLFTKKLLTYQLPFNGEIDFDR